MNKGVYNKVNVLCQLVKHNAKTLNNLRSLISDQLGDIPTFENIILTDATETNQLFYEETSFSSALDSSISPINNPPDFTAKLIRIGQSVTIKITSTASGEAVEDGYFLTEDAIDTDLIPDTTITTLLKVTNQGTDEVGLLTIFGMSHFNAGKIAIQRLDGSDFLQTGIAAYTETAFSYAI